MRSMNDVWRIKTVIALIEWLEMCMENDMLMHVN